MVRNRAPGGRQVQTPRCPGGREIPEKKEIRFAAEREGDAGEGEDRSIIKSIKKERRRGKKCREVKPG